MPDLRLTRTPDWEWDLEFTGLDLAVGDDLETAVVISLLSWARRLADDPNPSPNSDPMGWWADFLLEDANDFVGSKLWLAHGEKASPDLLLQISQWGKDALRWMIDDGVATDATVEAERVTTDRIDILVTITKPNGSEVFRYSINWAAQAARSA